MLPKNNHYVVTLNMEVAAETEELAKSLFFDNIMYGNFTDENVSIEPDDFYEHLRQKECDAFQAEHPELETALDQIRLLNLVQQGLKNINGGFSGAKLTSVHEKYLTIEIRYGVSDEGGSSVYTNLMYLDINTFEDITERVWAGEFDNDNES